MNRRFFRYYYLRFIRLQGDPQEIARGIAIGIFVGITPTIPLHTLLVLVLALFCRASKLAGLLASCVVSNPLTFFLQYYLSWRLGTWLTPYELSWERIHEIMAIISGHTGFEKTLAELGTLGWEAIAVMLVGGAVLALPFAVAGYFLSLYFYKRLRRKRFMRRAENYAIYEPADDKRYP